MSNRFFAEGCLLAGCAIASFFEGPAVLVFGIIGVIAAEVAIAKMKRNDFVGQLDHRAARHRRRR